MPDTLKTCLRHQGIFAMAHKKNPVTWCRPSVCGQVYDVVIANPSNSPWFEDEDLPEEAITHTEATTIAVRDTISDSRKEDCLIHEVVIHAIMEASGIGRILKEKYAFKDKEWDDFEEDLARLYSPAILSTLKTNGWLKLPKIPVRGRTKTASVMAASKQKKGSRTAKKR